MPEQLMTRGRALSLSLLSSGGRSLPVDKTSCYHMSTRSFPEELSVEYRFQEDILLVQEITGQSRRELASKIGVGAATLERWVQGDVQPPSKGWPSSTITPLAMACRSTRIKAQLRTEELAKTECRLLFHGSKSGIDGPLSLAPSRANNDFGRGFYCGENLEQSAMFVNQYPTSSIYWDGLCARRPSRALRR